MTSSATSNGRVASRPDHHTPKRRAVFRMAKNDSRHEGGASGCFFVRFLTLRNITLWYLFEDARERETRKPFTCLGAAPQKDFKARCLSSPSAAFFVPPVPFAASPVPVSAASWTNTTDL